MKSETPMEPSSEASPAPERVLPDSKVCRARGWIGIYALCLVENPSICRYAVSFNTGHFCNHPQRKAIVAKTKADNKHTGAST